MSAYNFPQSHTFWLSRRWELAEALFLGRAFLFFVFMVYLWQINPYQPLLEILSTTRCKVPLRQWDRSQSYVSLWPFPSPFFQFPRTSSVKSRTCTPLTSPLFSHRKSGPLQPFCHLLRIFFCNKLKLLVKKIAFFDWPSDERDCQQHFRIEIGHDF